MASVMKSRRYVRDRISSLPNHVAHHILSFLSMRELARFCLTSKKNRELCISIPFLAFDGVQYKTSSVKRLQFINYVDRFIALRKGMETRRISVRWSFEKAKSDEEYRVLTWLHNAIGCKVEFLDLEFVLNKEGVFILPFHVFQCESLKELKVNLHGGNIKLPSPSGFSMLRSLSLKGIRILDETFGEWVSSFCKQLEQLHLQIRGTANINIKSSSLQHLTIINESSTAQCTTCVSAEMLEFFYLDWVFDSSSGKTLNICAPNLEHLHWHGYLVNSYQFENLEHLNVAAIDLTPHISARNGNLSYQNLFELLDSICSVKELHLYTESIKVLFQQGCLTAATFYGLRDLYIMTRNFDDELVPAISCLFKATRSLESLYISYHSYAGETRTTVPSKAYGFTLAYWESQNLEFVHHLKDTEIELFHEGDNVLELIKYLLKHANLLQSMTIMWSPPLPSEIIREICDYEQASAVELVFLQKAS